jgi:hypothetical protein
MLSKRVILALFAILTVSSLITVNPVEANPASYYQLYDNVIINVQSPQNGSTYNVTSLPMYFTVESNNIEQSPNRYILNSQTPVNVNTWVVSQLTLTGWYSYGDNSKNYSSNYARYTAQGNAVLNNLSNGKYNLIIERYYTDVSKPEGIKIINSTTISFTIDTTSKNATPVFSVPPEPYPKLTLYSPVSGTYVALNNQSYNSNSLLFEVSALPSWAGYSLDDGNNITLQVETPRLPIYYNGKLIDIPFERSIQLPLGSHTLTLYTNDTKGNWANPQTVNFKVITFEEYATLKTPNVNPAPIPIPTLTTSITNPTPISTPIPTPTVPELSWLVVVPLLLSLLSVAVTLRHRKTSK